MHKRTRQAILDRNARIRQYMFNWLVEHQEVDERSWEMSIQSIAHVLECTSEEVADQLVHYQGMFEAFRESKLNEGRREYYIRYKEDQDYCIDDPEYRIPALMACELCNEPKPWDYTVCPKCPRVSHARCVCNVAYKYPIYCGPCTDPDEDNPMRGKGGGRRFHRCGCGYLQHMDCIVWDKFYDEHHNLQEPFFMESE